MKQGKDSVGVHRQYTGSAWKVTNCQIAVTLSIATADSHVPLDVELYVESGKSGGFCPETLAASTP